MNEVQEMNEVSAMLDGAVEKMFREEASPGSIQAAPQKETQTNWWDIRRVDNLNFQWKQVNDHFFKRQEMGEVDQDEWEKQLAIQISVNLSPYTTPTTIQRCINVMRRTSSKATKHAAIDLIRDRHTPLEKRFAVLEHRARIHQELIDKKKVIQEPREGFGTENAA